MVNWTLLLNLSGSKDQRKLYQITDNCLYQRTDFHTENYRPVWRQTHYNVTDKNTNVSFEDLDIQWYIRINSIIRSTGVTAILYKYILLVRVICEKYRLRGEANFPSHLSLGKCHAIWNYQGQIIIIYSIYIAHYLNKNYSKRFANTPAMVKKRKKTQTW